MLIAVGSALVGFAIKAVLIPHGFVSGGVSGLGVLLSYVAGGLTPGWWYFLLNIPVLLLGWFSVSRRFFFYTVFGIAAVSAAIELIPWTAPLHDRFLVVLAGGTLFGAGSGIALRSLGSTGGMDIVAVFLNNRFNIRMGQVSFPFTLLLLLSSMHFLGVERPCTPCRPVRVAMVLDYFLSCSTSARWSCHLASRRDRRGRAARIHRGDLHGRHVAYTATQEDHPHGGDTSVKAGEIVYTSTPRPSPSWATPSTCWPALLPRKVY
jgi:uncharacterized membrane protein YczE